MAGAGAVVLGVALLLPWFSVTREGMELGGASTGWQWLSYVDVYLLAVAATGSAAAWRPEDRAVGTAAAYGSVVGMMAVLYRLVDPPNADGVRFILEHQIKAGPFVALLGLGLIALATARRIRVRER